MQENSEKSGEIQGNPEKSREIQGNPGKSRKIQENPEKSWKIHGITGKIQKNPALILRCSSLYKISVHFFIYMICVL